MSEENASSSVRLLTPDGNITDELERCLKHIFAKYCTPPVEMNEDSPTNFLTPSTGARLSPEGLDRWATDTNGETFSEATKEEIWEFFDCTDNWDLTLKGFLQLYQLQTSNDESETWKDLEKHGFDRDLKLERR